MSEKKRVPYFQSQKSNIEWDIGDLFVRIALPAMPIIGLAAIVGCLAFYFSDAGEDNYGLRSEALASALLGVLMQTVYVFLLVLPHWMNYIVTSWSKILL